MTASLSIANRSDIVSCRVVDDLCQRSNRIDRSDAVVFNHGRGNNWSMSFAVQRPDFKVQNGNRNDGKGAGEKGDGKKLAKKKPEFDTMINIKHFDLYAENRAMVEAVKEKVRSVHLDSQET